MAGIDAFGTVFKRSNMAGAPVFTAIANVTNITSPELTRETIDVTAHDSPNGWREHIGGIKDGGEVSLELNYDPADHDVLVEDLEDDVPRDYQIIWPTGAQWDFKAILTKISAEAPMDDKLSAEHAFKVTGKPAIT